jgi:hypothetical protein
VEELSRQDPQLNAQEKAEQAKLTKLQADAQDRYAQQCACRRYAYLVGD